VSTSPSISSTQTDSRCPACGPVPAFLTSRYCARHLRQLRASWLGRREPATGSPAGPRDRAN
jgi:hypothetical protein